MDRLIKIFDKGLRVVVGVNSQTDLSKFEENDSSAGELTTIEKKRTTRLFRVNHTGEVCAQALYQGQLLASKSQRLQQLLQEAAEDEEMHLKWTKSRLEELGGRVSYLNPFFYAGSLTIGFLVGRFGDPWSLGFLKETEFQVEAHLAKHLERLSKNDGKSRRIIEKMKEDELGHAISAERRGGRDLPNFMKNLMKLASGTMTRSTYWF